MGQKDSIVRKHRQTLWLSLDCVPSHSHSHPHVRESLARECVCMRTSLLPGLESLGRVGQAGRQRPQPFSAGLAGSSEPWLRSRERVLGGGLREMSRASAFSRMDKWQGAKGWTVWMVRYIYYISCDILQIGEEVKTKRYGYPHGVPGIRLADEKDPLPYIGRKSWLARTPWLTTVPGRLLRAVGTCAR